MRFLVQPAAAPRARAPVRVFLVFAALALVGLGAQRVTAGGLSAEAVEALYLGVAEGEGLPAAALWEELHAGAFTYGLVLFMLASLLAASPVAPGLRNALVAAAFAATLADLLAPLAIVGANAPGALRVATFGAASASLAALLVAVAAAPGGAEGGARA